MSLSLSSIEEQVKPIIAGALYIDPALIASDTSIEELGADSLDAISIVMEVTQKFDLAIAEEELAKCRSCGEITATVFRHLQARTEVPTNA